jgi:hypothetical protein
MSLEASVASVLRSDPVDRISFSLDGAASGKAVAVNKKQMEGVAKAIEKHDIVIELGGTGSLLGAAYSSWKTRRLDAGERRIIGKIIVGSVNVTNSVIGKAAVFHESVHALMDVNDFRVAMHEDEVIAYLADALYLRASKLKTVAGGTQELAIYNAAFAIVDRHKLLDKPGATLKGSDCDALRNAIKAHPAYE